MSFSEILLHWFEENRRDLPWRHTHDPYKIWVSEIILQQTRVVQGMEYYFRFIEKFPTVQALAQADEEEVLKIWQGLGYYSRARNMHTAAQQIIQKHKGIFPKQYTDIKALKGVGNYTAAAIASIAFQLPYPAVDGNVLRFVARYTGNFNNIALGSTRKEVEDFCSQVMPVHAAGEFNQAMMEMGATCCTPNRPACEECPFSPHCFAFLHDKTDFLPFKEIHLKTKKRYFHYLIFLHNNHTLIQKRTKNDIWKNLYEFPLIESTDNQFNITNYLKNQNIRCAEPPALLWETKHLLTHQTIYAQFYIISVHAFPDLSSQQRCVEIPNLANFAVSKITEQVIGLLSKA